jgi:hypothetical protein
MIEIRIITTFLDMPDVNGNIRNTVHIKIVNVSNENYE